MTTSLNHSENAFVLIHFGNKKKYLELEIYFLIMLNQNTNNDIIYMYSINDTPQLFIDTISGLNICKKVIPYNDTNITYNLQQSTFTSKYEHFNTLRTCAFIFAYNLTKYNKVCTLESDMIVLQNIDSIFNLHCPAVLYLNGEDTDNRLIDTNYKVHIDNQVMLNGNTYVNGGVMLFKPSTELFQTYLENLPIIIENNSHFPNEALFVYTNPDFYNIPFRYDFSNFPFKSILASTLYDNVNVYIYHFCTSKYKPLDYIKDGWMNKLNTKSGWKRQMKEMVLYFRDNYYNTYHTQIDKVLQFVPENK